VLQGNLQCVTKAIAGTEQREFLEFGFLWQYTCHGQQGQQQYDTEKSAGVHDVIKPDRKIILGQDRA
jgi:hypothetical protein